MESDRKKPNETQNENDTVTKASQRDDKLDNVKSGDTWGDNAIESDDDEREQKRTDDERRLLFGKGL